ncbi:MAG: acyl-CoA dehydrogenase family protein [Frankiaceae bacterium]
MHDLSAEERQMVDLVAKFVDSQVRPVAAELEHSDTYPAALIEVMQAMGVFGLVIPQPYGEAAVSTACFARIVIELSRGWMSLAGAMGGHSVISKLLVLFGTKEQKQRWLPRLATGEIRAAMALTEPGGGSDLQAMRTVARRDGDAYLLRGSKTWITNAQRAALIAVLCKTNPDVDPPHRGISLLLCDKTEGLPGFVISRNLPKLGYKGVESCELAFDACRVPVANLLGGVEGRGFAQMMKGLELGRIQVAARAVGVATAAFDDALGYAQQREAFGKPIWQHESVGNYLADMATQISAARLLTMDAAARLDRGERCDMEAGMAKLFASEACMDVALNAMRIHGGNGYSAELDVERYFRDAPLMIVGEGTNEIQHNVIVGQLVRRGGLHW